METRKAKFTFKSKELSFIPVYYSNCMYKWVDEKEKIIKKIKKIESTEHFIELSKKIFGSYAFNYSLCKFFRTSTPVMLKCNKCGEYFKVFPLQHLNGKIGCPECSDLRKVIDNSDRLNYFHYYVKRKYRGLFGVPRNNDPKKIFIKCNGCGYIFRSTIEDIQNNLACPRCGIDFREDILNPEILEKEEKKKRLKKEMIEERERRLKQENKNSSTVIIKPFDYSVYNEELNKVRKSYNKIDKRKDSLESEINNLIFIKTGLKIEYISLKDKLNKILLSYKRSFRSIKKLENYSYGFMDISKDKSNIENSITYINSYIKVIDDKLRYI